MKVRPWRRLVSHGGAAVVIAALGVVSISCPSRELTIDIGVDGVFTLLSACESAREACAAPGACPSSFCAEDPVTGACVLRDRCHVDGLLNVWERNRPKFARLVLVDEETRRAKQATGCFPIPPEPNCNESPRPLECIAAKLDGAVATVIADGFTFPDFEDPETTTLGVGIFQPPDDADWACDPLHLVACAGLGQPRGGGDYDITCASCQDGHRVAVGTDTGPCPAMTAEDPKSCFLTRCKKTLDVLGR